MRGILTRVASVLSVALLAGCSTPAPVPDGYSFPTWNVGEGGAAALMEGVLVVAAGCLYVEPEIGLRYLVVWPDTLRLVIDSNVPVLLDGGREVARAGRPVRLGGGEITPPLVPASASACDRSNVWGTNAIVPPG